MNTDGDLLHTVTTDNISDSRKRLGKLMVWGTALFCVTLALQQTIYQSGRVSIGFETWRPILYAYMLWATALCAAQVIVNGEKGKRTLFVLPAALFVITLGTRMQRCGKTVLDHVRFAQVLKGRMQTLETVKIVEDRFDDLIHHLVVDIG